MDHFSNALRKATLHKINQFQSIRGKESLDIPFWDIVVLTALDDSQQSAYYYQLQEKLKHKELPLNVKYHVFSDPVGKKVGNGGSTLMVIEELEKIYKDDLANYKVLIIHAGGFSQRLPNASLLGKIFMSLPLGNPIFQMLELKMAMYIEFPSRMSGGMFVCSADTIELYVLEDDWTFKEPGFTALGHPSPIEIGTTHGVFVLEKNFMNELEEKSFENQPAVMKGKCRKFLHKPSRELMRNSNAVFHKEKEEYIFSDSAFYIDYDSCCRLLKWYRIAQPLHCEIDAYGDFLQSLGPEGNDDYCSNVRNVTEVTDNLVSTRKDIFQLLHGSQLNVLLMNRSKFYHIGTFPEYIEHFCGHGQFRYELGTSDKAMVSGLSGEEKFPRSIVLLHTVIENNVTVKENCIIEHSILKSDVCIDRGCILSNVIASNGLKIPRDSFMHTICIKTEESSGYVSLCFNTKDNLKKCVSKSGDANNLLWFGVPLPVAARACGINQAMWSPDCQFLNLWHARLFPMFASPEESFSAAAKMANVLHADAPSSNSFINQDHHNQKRFSMAQLLNLKDLMGQLKMRDNLRTLINDS